MKIIRILITAFILILPDSNLSGQLYFSDLNLSQDDRLLFKTDFESSHDTQNAVFITNLENNLTRQLTAFPEKLYIADNGRTIFVLNKFGAVKIPVTGGLPEQIKGYPSFAQGSIPLKGRLQDAAVSNDGRWVVYIDPVSPSFGTLIILNTANGRKQIICEKIELPSGEFPVKWSPDSRMFVYAKESKLYYFPILSDLSVLVDEKFRMIGSGGITSVVWSQQGDFFYFDQGTLYRIRNPELFTRTIYGDFLSIGSVAVSLPFDFDPGFDRYWVAPDLSSILLNKNNKSLFVFLLGSSRAGSEESGSTAHILPHAAIPNGAENMTVLWSAQSAGAAHGSDGLISVIFTAGNKTNSLRFEITRTDGSPDGRTVRNIPALTSPSSPFGAVSPDGSRAVFWGEAGLELWDFASWRLIQKLKEEKVFSCAWIGNGRFIAGNAKQIEEINILGSVFTQRRICLSGADRIGFEERGQRVLALTGSDWYATNTISAWMPANDPALRQANMATSRYRVFLDPQGQASFKNIPMIRNLNLMNTTSFASLFSANKAYPQTRTPVRIALCFDLYDDDAGLYQVLSALRLRNIRATFFLNGEFIRRNPASAKAIADSGHEAASMFYAPIDFSDTRYRITREFITQGLARNEDEYFNATGKELMLLWHPPFYRNSNLISSAAAASGYNTIERTIDLNDWVTREESIRLNISQTSPSLMIEQIVHNARPNSIIPIRLGRLSGGRDEYLFQRIDALLDALARSGIEVVTVSALGR